MVSWVFRAARILIYFAPAVKQGIVVGEQIPPELLQQAEEREARRRQRLQAQLGVTGRR